MSIQVSTRKIGGIYIVLSALLYAVNFFLVPGKIAGPLGFIIVIFFFIGVWKATRNTRNINL